MTRGQSAWTSSIELLAGIDLPGLRGDVHQRLFGGPAARADPAPAPARPDRLPRGAVVDRYVILELLGSGGMGVVYAAYDPQLDRRVALKLLRATARVEIGRARMIREAHALAKLSHPNVVTVFDAGIHDGEVFLAMELVEGETLRAWLQQRERAWQQSLPVLILAGRGLASAHAAGILHRDFKPENVMIDAAASTGVERVRVMDFGLARRSGVESGETTPLEAELAASQPDADITRTGALLGTPAYMAPELFASASGDARSDQFAFCVTAWEALFGERPHARPSVRAQVDAVRSGAAPRAPAGTRVPGWLQRTLARGLAVDPAERWPSLEALLGELERGRTRMRRRRGLSVLLGVASLGGLGYGGMVLAEREREAECERTGHALDELWNDDTRQAIWTQFESTGSPIVGETFERLVPSIDRHVAAWQHARTEVCMATDAHAVWSDALGDAALWCLDDRRMELGALLSSATDADAAGVANAVSAAAALSEIDNCTDPDVLRLAPAPPLEQRDALREVAAALARLPTQRLPPDQRAHELEVLRDRADALGWAPMRAQVRITSARLDSTAGSFDEAEAEASAAFHLAAQAGAWDLAAAAALAHARISGTSRMHYREGREWIELTATAMVHAGPSTAHREGARQEALGDMLEREAKPDEARVAFARAIEIFETTLGPEHPRVAKLMCRLGVMHRNRGDYASMRAACRRGLELSERALGPSHPDTAGILHTLGVTYFETGEPLTARAMYTRAYELMVASNGERHIQTVNTLMNQGIVASLLGEDELAFELYRRTLALRIELLGPDHPRVATTLRYTGELELERGDAAAARTSFARALDLIETTRASDHIDLTLYIPPLADAHGALGELATMRRLYDRALLVVAQAGDTLDEGRVRTEYGRALRRAGWLPEARAQLERAIRVGAVDSGPLDPGLARSLTELAELELDDGHVEVAIARLEHALVVYATMLPFGVDDHDAELALAKALDRMGRDPARARALASTALAGYREAPGMQRGRIAEVEAWLRGRPAPTSD